MRTRYIIGLTAFAAALAAVTPHARGQDGGMLSTMPQGNYQCALPGDAGGAAYTIVEGAEFRLGAASSYHSENGSGVYILKGKSLTFTRGPRKGERYRRIGTNQLTKINPDGSLSKLLCTRIGAQRFSED